MISNVFKLLTGLLLACVVATSVHAQSPNTGSIIGEVVVDDTIKLEGASVRLLGTDRRASTDRDGVFRFSQVAPGDYELEINYVGSPALSASAEVVAGQITELVIELTEDAQMDRMVVVGQAAIQSASLSRERAAINNINVLSADAIGQFPDNNVAEALQRVSGLSLQRDQGEGRFVVIRGANANFNTTTFNGLRVPGPEDDSRAVNLDVVSSDLVESVEISKSLMPSQDADGVGGNIEVTTLSAFDLGNSVKLNAQGSYNETLEKTSPRINLTGTRLFSVGGGVDNLAVSASINYFDREFAVDNVEAGIYPEVDAPGGGVVRAPEAAEQRDYQLSRERTGGVLNFDYRPNAQTELYLRTLYSEFADNEIELEHEYIFEDGDIVDLNEGGGIFSGGEVERRGKETTATREIMTIAAGGRVFQGDWETDFQLGYAEASTSEPFSLGTALIAGGLDIGYDFTGAGGREAPNLFGLDNGALEDLSAYELDLVELESDKTQEEEWSFEINSQRFVQWGSNPGRIQFGAKARMREKFNDANNSNFVDFDADYTLNDLVGPGQRDYPLGRFGPYVSTSTLRDFYFANFANWGIDQTDFLLDSEGEDYTLDENVYAAYFMAESSVGNWDLLSGVRVEQTDIEQSGFKAIVNEDVNDGIPTIEPFSGDNDYTDIFPNVQALYAIDDNWQFRAAYTRSMGRPTFEAAGARQVVEIEGGETVAEVGNPDLNPFYVNNFDAEFSYFANETLGAASIGVFYKDIEDFFVTTNIAGQSPFETFDEVESVINGDDAEVYGLELSYVQEFTFLPGPWSGLLLTANYTLVDSSAEVPFRDSDIQLPGQSDNIINVALGYDYQGLSLRLAANHRGEYFDEIEEPDDPTQDRYVSSETRLDFTSKYEFTENVMGVFNVSNITDEPFYAFLGDEKYANQYDEFGRTVELGVEVRF